MRNSKYNLKLALLMTWLAVLVFDVSAQDLVSGQVISGDDSEPLPGVTVLVKGTTRGVITDLDGRYSVQADSEEILVFSYIGYKTREILVQGQSVINITMDIDMSELAEVVVMGYSQKTQKELSASVVSLNAKELQNVTSPNLQTMLQGKVAGLTVTSSTGQPGSAADIRIRGITSVNADRPPLIVVDGMIGGNYVPNDIETVTVLKDAAAIGLYGAEGAAGVIVITTKQAKANQHEISFSSRFGFKEATMGNFEMMNGAELYEAQRQMWGENNAISFLTNRPEDLEDKNFNWMEAGFERAILHNHNLSMRGSSDKVSYGFNVDYFNEDGTFIKTNYERLNLRGNLKFSPTEKLTIQTDINAQVSSDQINHYSWFEDVFWNVPWDSPTRMTPEGSVLNGPDYITDPNNKWIGQFKRNFLHSAEYNQLGSNNNDAVWSTRMSYDITDWLTLETRTRLSNYSWRFKDYASPKTNEGRAIGGSVSESQGEGWGVGSTHFLRFNKSFGDHDLSAFVAHEGGYSINKETFITGINLSSQSIKVIDGASVIQDYGGFSDESTGISYISELSYGYAGKYFATAYYRVDGNSRFAKNKKYGYFPGGSLAWLISEESFLEGADVISFLKLRASYGHTGNSNIPLYLSMATYNISRRYNGQPGGEPDNPANPELGWETTRMANLGLDLSLFNNALSLNVDVYHKSVSDMLFRNPLAFSTGYEARMENIADMRNRGIELSLGYTRSFGDFTYSGNFNISKNQNEITKVTDILDEQPVVAGAIEQINKVGLEAFTWYMPRWMGVDPQTGGPQWEVLNTDENGNVTGRSITNVYDEATFQPIESSLPEVSGGFNNSFTYKNLTLSVLFTFQTGNHIYNFTREFVDSDGANTGVNLMKLHDGWSRWEKPGDNATHPVLKRGGSNGAHHTSSRYLEKGDYLRIRNISLSYSLPKTMLDWARINSASLSLGVDNLMTFTNFSGMDPDIGLARSDYSLIGMSYLKYPISKQYILGLNINF